MNEIEQIHLESKFQAMLDFADEIHSNGLDENIRIELTFLQNQIDKQYNENLEFAEKVKNEQELNQNFWKNFVNVIIGFADQILNIARPSKIA